MSGVDVEAEWEARIKLLKLMNDDVIEATIKQFQGLIDELNKELEERKKNKK
jgi:hypothetical protein